MTVAALPSVAEYLEDGVTTSFPAPFRFKAATDLIVERIITGTGTVTTLAIGVDYAVVGGQTDAGGTITRTAATNGAMLKIRRNTARAQPMVYTTGDRFPAVSHEEALDRQMLIAQEQAADHADLDSRALTVPPGEIAPPLAPLADRIGGTKKVLAIDQDSGAFVVEPIGETFQGNTGPANSTYPSLASLAAGPTTNQSAILAPSEGSGLTGATYTWKAGNYTGRNDVIASTWLNPATGVVVPISQGAWVLPDAGSTTFRQIGASVAIRDTQAKIRETVSVRDYYLPTDPDFTNAVTRAAATGKAVLFPTLAGGYPVLDIPVVDNMQVVGEKAGKCLGPELVVRASNGSAFKQFGSTAIAVHLVFSDLTIRAGAAPDGTPYTNVRGFYSEDKSRYSAYVDFINIETHRNLIWAYDLLPIFGKWTDCRDGYLPGNEDYTMPHGFIKAEAATYGQTNATNSNNVLRAMVFGCFGVDASIQIAFGDTWLVEDCRFENMFVPAVKAESVVGLYLIRNRSEGFHTTEWCTLREMSGSGVGTIAHIDTPLNAIDRANFFYATTDALSRVGFQRGSFSIIGPNQRLVSNPLSLLYNRDHPTIAGAGAAGLMTDMDHSRRVAGQDLDNGAISNGNVALTKFNRGGTAATQGFASGNPAILVATAWVTIFTPASSISGVLVGGIQPGTGVQNAWWLLCTDSAVDEFRHITPGNSVVAEFRKTSGALQMRCTTGTANVVASALTS